MDSSTAVIARAPSLHFPCTSHRIASSIAPLSNWVIQSSLSRYFMDRFLGIERKRKLPRFYRQTFEKRFPSMRKQILNPKRKLVYFVDLVANYSEPELGVRAATLLQQSGFEVVVLPRLMVRGSRALVLPV